MPFLQRSGLSRRRLKLVIRDFHAGKLVFDGYYQFNAVEPGGPEVIFKVRLIHNTLNVDAQMLGNDSADREKRSLLDRCQAPDAHDKPPIVVMCSESGQALRPG
jgi:hypothetical protein